ncbi:OsmC family peroxiredoxin [Sphingobacteriales bacterium UPWRP_1]|nr:osmotically inducible protein OsmC [Sphingobacteriales bacterium TSM_CSM]PSJ71853.1 OsmC family peroxiredoxin [Sphingobacteriales bacterium UPWRP_1]
MTSEVIYTGQLRTEAVHLQSGSLLITDAPTDNNGLGQAFSPTDLVATALATCMLTIMGIVAQRNSLHIDGTRVTINKIMQPNPRKIAKIEATLYMPEQIVYTDKDRALLENAARTCPVALSLNPDIEQDIRFVYP